MHNGQVFVLAIIALGIFGGIAKMWIRARHGLPIETRRERRHRDRYADDAGPDAERKIHLLSTENERLVGQVSRLEERIAVLERIATDPAERTAREIEALRGQN
ncbi:MAG: hypothetical protein P0Y59_07635 [Candidatus Sphingomonas phytovorans]|nr:hypothetical protein [Sphingomonas sp.]WEK01539.1 MAG: hypothetical protein P0Y59_07635 [Sphingomonas sp.]